MKKLTLFFVATCVLSVLIINLFMDNITIEIYSSIATIVGFSFIIFVIGSVYKLIKYINE